MNEEARAYLELHFSVFLYGLTAILGDLIMLNAIQIVWWRLLLTVFSLLFIRNFIKIWRKVSHKRKLQYAGIGLLVGVHWILFYGAVKLSNASVTLVCLATSSFFTSLIEPLIMKRNIKWYEILLGVIVIPGMILVVDGIEEGMYWGVPVALASALFAALFGTLNKKMITQSDPITISTIELSSALILLTVILPFATDLSNIQSLIPSGIDWAYLVFLALFCTTLAYILTVRALRQLTAFSTALAINMEPVYGIILAWILLDDAQEMSGSFYYGVIIIILAVFSYPVFRRIGRKKWM